MLIKPSKTFDLKSLTVKTVAAFLLLGVSTPMVAHSADTLKTRYSLRFDFNALNSEKGLKKAYKQIEKKAKRACRSGSTVDDMGHHMSRKACEVDLVEQFVTSTEYAPLINYHAKQTPQSD